MNDEMKKSGRTTFSQFGEDIILNHIFDNIYKIKTGHYLDIGCFDPYYLSNTTLLYQKGWSGINIDANPDSIEAFETNRPNDTNLNFGVSDVDTTLEYHLFRAAASNTFDSKVRDENIKKGWGYKGSILVHAKPVMKIALPHLHKFNRIDYLNIDIEGLDEVALKGIDFEIISPLCITIETHRDFLRSRTSSIQIYLEEKGYFLYSHAGITSFFLKAS